MENHIWNFKDEVLSIHHLTMERVWHLNEHENIHQKQIRGQYKMLELQRSTAQVNLSTDQLLVMNLTNLVRLLTFGKKTSFICFI